MRAATYRSLAAGFEVAEVHSAHGYLLHEFLSASLERPDGRVRRLAGEPGAADDPRLRSGPPDLAGEMAGLRPDLRHRLGGRGWDLPQSIELAKRLKAIGVDLIDCSSGHRAECPDPGWRGIPGAVRGGDPEGAGIPTGAVGMITEGASGRGDSGRREGGRRPAGAIVPERSVLAGTRREDARREAELLAEPVRPGVKSRHDNAAFLILHVARPRYVHQCKMRIEKSQSAK